MKKKIILSTVVFITLLILTGCYKEDLQSATNTKSKSTLTELFKNIAPPKQNFSVNAGQQIKIVGAKGTNITFYPTSFKKKDGTILTSGSVTVILQEMLTGPEMMLAGKTTTSNGKILVSGGQFFVNATLNGEQLFINPDSKPKVTLPSNQAATEMSLFKGNPKENDSIAGDTTIDWEIKKDTMVHRIDSISDNSGIVRFDWTYSFGFEEFGYYNCDKFYDWTSPRTEIKVKTPNGFDHTNTHVYVYFKSINSVIKLEGFDKNSQTFFINHSEAPIGLEVTIVAVAKKDNKHYLDVKSNIILTANYSTTSNLIESTEAAIKLAIKGL